MRACASGGETGVGFECGSALALAGRERHEVGGERVELAVRACTARNGMVSTGASRAVLRAQASPMKHVALFVDPWEIKSWFSAKARRQAGGQQASQKGKV